VACASQAAPDFTRTCSACSCQAACNGVLNAHSAHQAGSKVGTQHALFRHQADKGQRVSGISWEGREGGREGGGRCWLQRFCYPPSCTVYTVHRVNIASCTIRDWGAQSMMLGCRHTASEQQAASRYSESAGPRLTCSSTAAAVMAAGASNCALMGSARATVTERGMSARASSVWTTAWRYTEVVSTNTAQFKPQV
jgi:hypothetical protein